MTLTRLGKVPRTGVLFLPPVSEYAKKQVSILQNVSDLFVNYPIPNKTNKYQTHYFTTDSALIRNQDEQDVNFDCENHDLLVDETSGFNLDNPNSRQMAIMLAMIKKAKIERLLIAAPVKIPALFVHIALKYLSIDKLRVIVDDKLQTNNQIRQALIKKQATFEKTYQNLLNKQDTIVQKSADECLLTPSGTRLRSYQQNLVDFVLANKRCGLFVDMGLGKTLATLASLNELVNRGEIDIRKPVLIVAPIMVALDTWSREAEKWGYDFDVLVNIKKTPKQRKELFEDLIKPKNKLTLLTTNPQQLKPLTEFLETNGYYNFFQTVIVDELSQFKSATTQRFKYLERISHQSEYFIGLTGTPTPNSLLDLYSQLIAINPKNKRYYGSNFYIYRSEFFVPDIINPNNGQVYHWKPKPDAQDKIFKLLKQDVISLKSDGLVDLPDIVFDDRYVKLPSRAQKTYEKLNKDLRDVLRKLDKENAQDKMARLTLNDSEINVANSAILTSKLLQLSSGAIYSDLFTFNNPDIDNEKIVVTQKKKLANKYKLGENQEYETFHDEKLKMLKDIVDNATSPVLVFFYFKSELDRMKDYFDFEYLDPHRSDIKDLISRWNNGDVPVLVAHPASAGHGLNLQDGGHIMVWLTLPWSNEQYRQSIKRLYRSGQTNTVSVIRIIAANTYDQEVLKRLDKKESGQDELMTHLDTFKR